MHGGIVNAHSAGTGQGSEFIVELPTVEVRADAPEPPRSRQGLAVTPRKILVVDDNDDAGA